MSESLDRLESLFAAALQQSPADRAAYLEQACADDQALRQRVEARLGAQVVAGILMEPPPPEHRTTVEEPQVAEQPGKVIGPYKLLEQIGEGGFGVVFLAEQQEPIRRRVALKIIKPGMDTRQVIARFEAERQALALMDHPNIARVIDAGETTSGRPFFVMELVIGLPITEFCDQAKLPPRARLELFASVCQAVQHAHLKGIIHRDIKPSNVLVTLHDGKPVAKVIDFGIAKATGVQLTEKTLFTNFAAMIGTPLYMSPEQAGLSGQDIDTRSDIYSLGVLLYELLTGTTPFTKERFKQATYDEIRRIIREEEPPKPSTRLSGSKDSLASISARRHTDPTKLTKLVRGELDWIVMKALEKDRNRRYETANGFLADVQRYLADEPVQAGPPAAVYRLRKFVRRHKRLLAGALAFVLLLLSAVGALSLALLAVSHEKKQTQAALEAEAKRRRQYRETLDRQTSFVMRDLLGRQAALTDDHKNFLRQALEAYEEFAADAGQDAEARSAAAGAYDRVGMIRQELGDYREAETAYRAGLAIIQGLMAKFPGEPRYRSTVAAIQNNLGDLLLLIGRPQEAEAADREAVASHRQLVADFPEAAEHRDDLAGSLHNLGNLLDEMGRPGEAEPLLRESVALRQKLVADSPQSPKYRFHLARGHNKLADHFAQTGRAQDAEVEFREALNLYRQLVAERGDTAEYRNRLARTLTSLGNLLRRRKQLDEALPLYREAVAVQQKLAGDYPAVPRYRESLAGDQHELAELLIARGPIAEAEPPLRDAAALLQQLVSLYPDVPGYRESLVRNRLTLSSALYQMKRREEAEAAVAEALPLLEKLVADHPTVPAHANNLAGVLGNLAVLKNGAKDYAAAGQLLDRALHYHRAALKANPRHEDYRAFYRNNLYTRTITHLRLGEHTAAVTVAERMVEAILDPGFDNYKAASLFSRCAETAGKDDTLPEAERTELARKHADRAVALLGQAVANGYRDVAELKKNTAFDSLRPREDFQKLIAELEAKGK